MTSFNRAFAEGVAALASGAGWVVAADPNPVSGQGALDVCGTAGIRAPRHGAGHAAVVVDQQWALTNHGDQARARHDSFGCLRCAGEGLQAGKTLDAPTRPV